eukprot:TRINITY_DN30616_c0_g1_i1.p1 TRINITY_DN30616_c0_g1~~TRINITY_DN30616_c0_g1_i1.p1  ORF type:complete len:266 (+),score=46.16 TRINITY_DN30616_c0_g1_i1:129-926(+)
MQRATSRPTWRSTACCPSTPTRRLRRPEAPGAPIARGATAACGRQSVLRWHARVVPCTSQRQRIAACRLRARGAVEPEALTEELLASLVAACGNGTKALFPPDYRWTGLVTYFDAHALERFRLLIEFGANVRDPRLRAQLVRGEHQEGWIGFNECLFERSERDASVRAVCLHGPQARRRALAESQLDLLLSLGFDVAAADFLLVDLSRTCAADVGGGDSDAAGAGSSSPLSSGSSRAGGGESEEEERHHQVAEDDDDEPVIHWLP